MHQMQVEIRGVQQTKEDEVVDHIISKGVILEESEDGDVRLSGDCVDLDNDTEEEEWARELAYKVWRLNKEFCEVEVQTTNLETQASSTFLFEDEDYREWEIIYGEEE